MTGRSDLSRSEGKSEGLSESRKTSDTLDIEGVLHAEFHNGYGCEYHQTRIAKCEKYQRAARRASGRDGRPEPLPRRPGCSVPRPGGGVVSGEVCGCGHSLSDHGDDGCHAMDGNFAPCYCVPSTSEGERA